MFLQMFVGRIQHSGEIKNPGLGCCHSATSSMLTEVATEAKAAVEKSYQKDKNYMLIK